LERARPARSKADAEKQNGPTKSGRAFWVRRRAIWISETHPVVPTIIRFKQYNELVNRLVIGLFSFFPGQFNLSESIWFANDLGE